MTQDTYSALKQKIEKEILRLQKQAQALQTKQRGPVITSILRSMREYDITPDEIAEAYNKRTAGGAARKANSSGSATRQPVPIKYKHPETGETWTGRGKLPRWISSAEAQGKDRSDFLIVK